MNDYDASALLERAQTAEAIAASAKSANEPLKKEVQQIKATFGIRKRGDGRFEINYDTLVKAIGFDGWMELRQIGDKQWNVSGSVGEKPRVTVRAPRLELDTQLGGA